MTIPSEKYIDGPFQVPSFSWPTAVQAYLTTIYTLGNQTGQLGD
jgi:hypothetical protein